MNTEPPTPGMPGHMPPSPHAQPSGVGSVPATPGKRPTLRSADLLGGATAVDIEHLGQIYRLQTTRAGKLILTK